MVLHRMGDIRLRTMSTLSEGNVYYDDYFGFYKGNVQELGTVLK